MKKIELWGKMPPPLGGVTIYLKRLLGGLLGYTDVEVVDFSRGKKQVNYTNTRLANSLPKELLHLLFGTPKIIHLNSFNLLLAICFILFGWRHQYGITIHNQRGVRIKSPLKRKVMSMFLNRCSFIIMNDGEYKKRFAAFFQVGEDKIHILPAFIAPQETERRGLPSEVIGFKNKHDFLISGNAFKLILENGIDIYGLDMLIHLLKCMRDSGVNAGLLFCLPCIGNVEYYNQMKSLIDELELQEHIMIVNQNIDNAFEYWELSDLFIRPTTTDMEGISVKEALYMGTHVIASDVCKRPEECILFESRSQEDLNRKSMSLYESGRYKIRVNYKSMTDIPKEMLRIYQNQ